MSKLEKRLARLEEGKAALPRTFRTPEECCAIFGYTISRVVSEFGSFPAFCRAMLDKADSFVAPPSVEMYPK